MSILSSPWKTVLPILIGGSFDKECLIRPTNREGRAALGASLTAIVIAVSSVAVWAQQIPIARGITITVPNTWKVTKDTSESYLLEYNKADKPLEASMTVRVEKRRNHVEAVRRLAAIEAEYDGPVEYKLIAGWPALERKVVTPFQHPGDRNEQRLRELQEGEKMPPGHGGETSLQVTTAVAVGEFVVRLQTLLQPRVSEIVASQALAIGRTLTVPKDFTGRTVERPTERRPFGINGSEITKTPNQNASILDEQLKLLKSGKMKPAPVGVRSYASSSVLTNSPGNGRRSPGGGGNSIAVSGAGEIEAAASIDGQSLVTAARCNIAFSINGTSVFSASAVDFTGEPAAGTDNDCSVTWGQSGNFYLEWLGGGDPTAPDYALVFRSTFPDQGANFNSAILAVDRRCATQPGSPPPPGPGQLPVIVACLTIGIDQPHIAADRWNASGLGKDMVYVTWQENPALAPMIACSSDNGATWSQPKTAGGSTYSFPRVSVGRDGKVYVVSRAGSNIVIDKFSNCDDGLAEQTALGYPFSITIHDVKCPVPGLDRCNDGNTLSSPTIAVDDTNPSHVYLGWAEEGYGGTGADIVIADWTDDKVDKMSQPVALNPFVAGVRFMPWIVAWNGVAYAGWYDRSSAGNTQAQPNDLTRYHRGSASVVDGLLTSGGEIDLMGVDDPQCSSLWGMGVRSKLDATQCTEQPQFAGVCSVPNRPNPPTPITYCDFTDPACPSVSLPGLGIQVPLPCQTWSGIPRFGDYNGLAVGGFRLLNIWASSTAPADLPAAPDNTVRVYTAITSLCPANQYGNPSGCLACQGDSVVNANQTGCDACPANTVPNWDHSTCVAPPPPECDHDCEVRAIVAQNCSSTCSDAKTVAAKYHVCPQEAPLKEAQCLEDCTGHKSGFETLVGCSQLQAEALVQCRQTCNLNLGSLAKDCQKCLRGAAAIFNDPRCAPPPGTPPPACETHGGTQTGAAPGDQSGATKCIATKDHPCPPPKPPETAPCVGFRGRLKKEEPCKVEKQETPK